MKYWPKIANKGVYLTPAFECIIQSLDRASIHTQMFYYIIFWPYSTLFLQDADFVHVRYFTSAYVLE